MTPHDRAPQLFAQRRDGIRVDVEGEGTDVRRLLAEVLIQGLRVRGALHPGEVIGPHAPAKLVEAALRVGRQRERRRYRAAPSVTPAGLEDVVRREAATQEEVLAPLPAVGCCLPRLGALEDAMQEDQRSLAGILGLLGKDVSVIAVQRPALRRGQHRAPDGKTALLLHGQGRGGDGLPSAPAAEGGEHQQEQRAWSMRGPPKVLFQSGAMSRSRAPQGSDGAGQSSNPAGRFSQRAATRSDIAMPSTMKTRDLAAL